MCDRLYQKHSKNLPCVICAFKKALLCTPLQSSVQCLFFSPLDVQVTGSSGQRRVFLFPHFVFVSVTKFEKVITSRHSASDLQLNSEQLNFMTFLYKLDHPRITFERFWSFSFVNCATSVPTERQNTLN